jgi:hypothetical protein
MNLLYSLSLISSNLDALPISYEAFVAIFLHAIAQSIYLSNPYTSISSIQINLISLYGYSSLAAQTIVYPVVGQ